MLGVTAAYVGMLERGDKEVDATEAISKLLAFYENKDQAAVIETLREDSRGYQATASPIPSLRLSPTLQARLTALSRSTGIPEADLAQMGITKYLDSIEHPPTETLTKAKRSTLNHPLP